MTDPQSHQRPDELAELRRRVEESEKRQEVFEKIMSKFLGDIYSRMESAGIDVSEMAVAIGMK